MGQAPAWLASAAEAEEWGENELPALVKRLDEFGISLDLDDQRQRVCIRDSSDCEPIDPGDPQGTLRAIRTLLEREARRRKQDAKSAERSAKATAALNEREKHPPKPRPQNRQ